MIKSSNIQIPDVPPMHYGKTFESRLYTATVSGVPCGIRSCRVSAMPFNRQPSFQRPQNQTEMAAFMIFSGTGPVNVRVTTDLKIVKPTVRPLRHAVEVKTAGQTMEFTLPGPGQYVLEPARAHNALHIFYDPAGDDPDAKSATYYFGPGIHLADRIELKDNESVYIDSEAIVIGAIRGKNVDNIRVFGGGVLNDCVHERLFYDGSANWPAQSAIHLINCRHARIEGIVVQDSPFWCVSIYGCGDVVVDRIKVVGQWRYNTDGIDVVNSSDVTIRNSFFRAFDDGICLKGLDWSFKDFTDWPWHTGRPVENIRVSGCVVWCGWGRTLEIGIETDAPEFRDIVFEDCDLIHNSFLAIDIANGYGTDVHDVTYRNIRVEFQADTPPEILETPEVSVYAPGDRHQPPRLIGYHTWHYLPFETPCGRNYNITAENIQIYAEEGVDTPMIKLSSPVKDCFWNNRFRNITLNGKPVKSLRELDYVGENIEEPQWE